MDSFGGLGVSDLSCFEFPLDRDIGRFALFGEKTVQHLLRSVQAILQHLLGTLGAGRSVRCASGCFLRSLDQFVHLGGVGLLAGHEGGR